MSASVMAMYELIKTAAATLDAAVWISSQPNGFYNMDYMLQR